MQLKNRFLNPLAVAAQLFAGKSMLRTHMNARAQAISLSGDVLDLGGRGNSSYYSKIKFDPDQTRFVFGDLAPEDGSPPRSTRRRHSRSKTLISMPRSRSTCSNISPTGPSPHQKWPVS